MRTQVPIFLLLFLSARAFALDVKDATGVSVHIADHPNRIVTLAPSVAELAAEFLDVDLQRIVGVSESTDYPPALKSLPSVGPYQQFNLERIVALKPDLVLATFQGNAKDQVLHLRELGMPVFVFDTESFSKVGTAMLQMSELLGESSRGARVADRFKKSLEEMRLRGIEHRKNPQHVLVQLDDQPLVVAGGKSFLTEALATVGAVNIYADAESGYPHPSVEDVLKRNPDTILVLAFGPDLKPFSKMAQRWSQYPGLAANQRKQVKVVYADSLMRPSLRLLEGLAVLEKTLYGTR